MAQTQGTVERLKLTPGVILAWVYITDATGSTRLLLIRQDSADPVDIAARASMAEALSGALVAERPVTVVHGDDDVLITTVTVR
jgi:hypothetical protein